MTNKTSQTEQNGRIQPLLTAEDMAEHYAVSVATIRNWIYKGELPPPVRVKRRALGWRPETVLKWDQDHEHHF